MGIPNVFRLLYLILRGTAFVTTCLLLSIKTTRLSVILAIPVIALTFLSTKIVIPDKTSENCSEKHCHRISRYARYSD